MKSQVSRDEHQTLYIFMFFFFFCLYILSVSEWVWVTNIKTISHIIRFFFYLLLVRSTSVFISYSILLSHFTTRSIHIIIWLLLLLLLLRLFFSFRLTMPMLWFQCTWARLQVNYDLYFMVPRTLNDKRARNHRSIKPLEPINLPKRLISVLCYHSAMSDLFDGIDHFHDL